MFCDYVRRGAGVKACDRGCDRLEWIVMRWGLRSIFHAASAALLLVCALAMLLWIRSYFVADWLQVGNFTASTSAGDVEFDYFSSDAPARGRSGVHYGTNPARSMRHKSLWGATLVYGAAGRDSSREMAVTTSSDTPLADAPRR
jgi:hypothetical protein